MLISPEDGGIFQDRVLHVAVPTLGKEEHWEVTCEAELEMGRSVFLPSNGKLWIDRTHLSKWVPQANRELGFFRLFFPIKAGEALAQWQGMENPTEGLMECPALCSQLKSMRNGLLAEVEEFLHWE